MSVRFAIEEVFDLRQRGVILAAGRILHGTVAGPTMLRDERSGQVVRVLGVELLPAPAGDPDRIRLIIDPRSSTTRPSKGMVLVEPT